MAKKKETGAMKPIRPKGLAFSIWDNLSGKEQAVVAGMDQPTRNKFQYIPVANGELRKTFFEECAKKLKAEEKAASE